SDTSIPSVTAASCKSPLRISFFKASSVRPCISKTDSKSSPTCSLIESISAFTSSSDTSYLSSNTFKEINCVKTSASLSSCKASYNSSLVILPASESTTVSPPPLQADSPTKPNDKDAATTNFFNPLHSFKFHPHKRITHLNM